MGPSGIGKEHGCVFTSIVAEGDRSAMLRVASTRERAACPTCGVLSCRRHGWYTHRALDENDSTTRTSMLRRHWCLRNLAISLIRRLRGSRVTEAREYYAVHPGKLFRRLGLTPAATLK